MEHKQYDLVVVGGGVSGMCAAVAAARGGAKVALVQDRGVLGGNASSEIRMHICGADRHGSIRDARETGIIEEVLLINRKQNPQHSYCVQDAVFWDFCKREPNLDLYLNTRIQSVVANGGRIESVMGYQSTTEKDYTFSAPFFVDATGDGFVGYAAGAEYMRGRESSETYGESLAPREADDQLMGNSLMFTAKDMGHPVPFVKPSWAYTYTEANLANRNHSQITSGYWWIELSGKLDPIADSETIRDELLKTLYGIWDHIKNQPGHNSENYALDWVGFIPGRRETRRLLGDYVLCQKDLVEATPFHDVVGYGGWEMDLHVPGGILSTSQAATSYGRAKPGYGIPYRCLYSKNIENLFLAGRAISASHVAFGSTRVMGTCAVVGQAVGTAAALALSLGLKTARRMGEHMDVLQQRLISDDCYLPGVVGNDPEDLAKRAKVTASSVDGEATPDKVINGLTRNLGGVENAYRSCGISPEGEWLSLAWDKPVSASRVQVTFDSNLKYELTITISDEIRRRQRPFPTEIIKEYALEFYLKGKLQHRLEVKDNIFRHVVHTFPAVTCDSMRLCSYATHGAENITVFEVRVYEK